MYYFSSYLLLVFLTLIPSKTLLMVLLSLGMFMMLGKRLININQELKCSLWYVISNNYCKTTNFSVLLILAILANGIKTLILIPANNYNQSRGRTR